MRTLAIGDIHGCRNQLDDLLALVDPTPDDLIVTLGDYVDRGPDTRGVLDRLLALRRTHRVVCVRGNHEIMMVQAKDGGRDDRKMWLAVGGAEALGSYGPAPGRAGTWDDIPPAHWDFLRNGLVDYHETATHIFVHAGVYPDADLADQPESMLFWEFFPDAMRHHSGKRVVCGHSSQRSGVPKVIPGAVCIDTHAYGGGWLTCLDVGTGRYWQANALGRTRDGWLEEE